jgi:hypothetical protein
MQIRDFNPAKGQAFQGDVSIIPIPADIAIAKTDEIKPIDNKLILQEGELTGHHHHIALLDRPKNTIKSPRRVKPTKAVEGLMADALAGRIQVPTAKLYRDPAVAAEMQRRGILIRTDLAVGCLVIEGGPMVVTHQEHDGIRLPAGNYLIGRQIESAGAEERRVAD